LVAVEKLRLRTGDTLMADKRSLGSHVSSEPLSTSTSTGGVIKLSSLVFRATTLTLNMLIIESLPHFSAVASREEHFDCAVFHERQGGAEKAEDSARLARASFLCHTPL